MHDAPLMARNGFHVDLVVVARVGCVFAVLAVVKELAHLNVRHQFGHAAYVVVVKVRDQHMVDALDAGISHGGQNALGVAAVVAGPTSVDQQRLAGWRYEQRGLAAFNIDGIDAELASGRSGLCLGTLRRKDAAEHANGEQCGGGARLPGKPAAGRSLRVVVIGGFHVLQKCNPLRGVRKTEMCLLLPRESDGPPRLIE